MDKSQGKRAGVVWQFDQLGERTAEELAQTCWEYGVEGLLVKALDGVHWMGQFDRAPLAIGGASSLEWLVRRFDDYGIPVGAWVNVTRGKWREQAEQHAEAAIAAGGWLLLDLEPYERFVGAWPPVDGIDEYLGTLIERVNAELGRDDWVLAGCPDPRPARLEELRWERWRQHLSCIYPQVYWTDFQRPMRAVLDEAAAIGHADIRAMLPHDGWPEFEAALTHPICANGAALWRLGAAGPASLAAFGNRNKAEEKRTRMRVSREIYDAIEDASTRYNLDPALIAAVIQAESGFNPEAVGAAGKSFGLMQLHVEGAGAGHAPSDLLTVRTNVDLGAAYLRHNLDAFDGDLALAVSAYNQGAEGVRTRGIANQEYVDAVLTAYERFKAEGLERDPEPESDPIPSPHRRRRRRRFRSRLACAEMGG